MLALLSAPAAFCQTIPPRFEHITPADGLSNERVYTITQTPDGAMWFGTYHGLNRYDGYSITSYTTQLYDDPLIPLKVVNRIVEDGKGNLWILSRNRFLRFSLAAQRFEVIQRDTSGLFDESAFYFRGLAIDSGGNVWVGSLNRLQRFNPRDSSFTVFVADTNEPGSFYERRIMDVTVDRSGTVWALAYERRGNLYRFNASSNAFEKMPLTYTPTIVAERALLADSRGKIWIAGSLDGLIEFDPKTQASTVHKFPMRTGGAHVVSLFEDSRSRICVGGWAGLHFYDPATRQTTSYYENKSDPFALQIDMISSIYEDRSGNIWLGIWGGGVDVIKQRQKKFGHFTTALRPDEKSEWVTAIVGDSSHALWLGTGRGLMHFDWRTNAFRMYRFYNEDNSLRYGKNHVIDILQRSDGKLWVSTYQGGLVLLDPKKGKSTKYVNDPRNPNSISDNFLQHLLIDRDGDLWISGRTQGLNLLRKNSSQFIRFQNVKGDTTSLPTNRVWRPYQDRQGRLWVLLQGAGAALCRIDKQTGKFTRVLYDTTNPQSSRFQFRHIHEEPDGTFWLGGEDNGLVHFNPETGTYEQFTERNGMPYAYMGGFLRHGKNDIWFVTPKGLSQFNIEQKSFRTFQYGTDIREINFSTGAFCHGPNGYMYFGGRNGVTYFHPDSIAINTIPPETRIVDFQIFGKPQTLSSHILLIDRIELEYDEDYFAFGFVSLDFTDPKRNQFAYMMEGFDASWVYAGDRRYASYTHLDPGNYVFSVKSANNDGIWGAPARINITVRPAWWQTWWFRIAAVLVAAGALYALYRYRLAKLLEVERTRASIASDLHDDIGTTLTSIALFSDLAKTDVHNNAPLAMERLDRIAVASRVLLDQMNDIVWSVKPQNDSLQNAILRMTDVAATLFDAKGIEHTVTVPDKIDDRKLSMHQRRNILLIFKEMMNNVVKHSQATAVSVTVAAGKNGEITFTVQDNGAGFDPAAAYSGNGMKNMQSRAAAIGGTVTFDSTPGRGTKAELHVPVKNHMNW